jgi:hypothetical protein
MPLTKTAVLTGPRRSNYINYTGNGNTLQMNDGTEIFLFGGPDDSIDQYEYINYKVNLVANGIENQPLAVSEITVPGNGTATMPDDYFTGMLPITRDTEDNIYFATMSSDISNSSTENWINIFKIHSPSVGWRRWADQTGSSQNPNSNYSEEIQVADTASVTQPDSNINTNFYRPLFAGEAKVFQNEVIVERLNSWRTSNSGWANIRYIQNITWFRSNHLAVWTLNDRTSAGNEYYTTHIFATKNQVAPRADRVWTKGAWVSSTIFQYYSYGGSATTIDDMTQFGLGEYQGAYICGQTYQNSSTSYVSHVVNTWRFIPESGVIAPYGTPIAVGNSNSNTNSQIPNRYHRGYGHVISYLGRYNSNFYMAILGPDSDTNVDANIRSYILGTNGTSTLFNPKVLDAVTYFVHSTPGNRAAKYRQYQSNDETNTNAGYRWERALQNWTDSGKLRLWQSGNDYFYKTWYLDIDYTFGATNTMTFATNGVQSTDIPDTPYSVWRLGHVSTINRYPTRKDTNMYTLLYYGRNDINPGYSSTISTNNESFVYIPYAANSRNEWWNKIAVYTMVNDGITTPTLSNASATLLSPATATATLPKVGGVTLRFRPNIRTTATGGSGSTYYGWPQNVRGFRISANDGTTTTYYNGTTLGGTETTIPFYFNGVSRRSHEEVTIDLPGSAFTAGLTYTFKIAFVNVNGVSSAYSTNPFSTITFSAAATAKDTPTALRIVRAVTNGNNDVHVASIDNKSLVNRISITNPSSSQGRFSVNIGGFAIVSPTVVPAGGTLHVDTSHIVDQGDKVLVSGPSGGNIYISGTEGI